MADLFDYTTLNAPGVQNTLAYGINDSGQIAGYNWDPSLTGGGDRGFTYSAGQWTSYYVLSSFSTDVYGLNNSGTLVASYNDKNFTVDNGLVIANGQQTSGAAQSEYYGINNAGVIVGSSFTGSQASGFLIDGQNMTTISYPNASTFPHGINDNGSIVGFYKTAGGTYGGFLDSTTCPACFTPLGLNGAYSTFGYGINNSNLIVGVTEDVLGHYQGFLLDGTNYSLLDFPGAVNTYAAGINNKDQIVGWYDGANGTTHAFVANPVPEPPGVWLLMVIVVSLMGPGICLKRRNMRSQPQPGLLAGQPCGDIDPKGEPFS